jgi:hypothetical protein
MISYWVHTKAYDGVAAACLALKNCDFHETAAAATAADG